MKCGRWRNLHPSILAGLMLASFLSAAFAQQPTPEQISAIRASCRSDFMSQCAGVKPGGKEALECLKRNAGSVSPSCKAALDAVGPRPAENTAPAPTEAKPAPAAAAPSPAPSADEPPGAAAPPPGPTAAPTAGGPAAATGEGRKPSSPQVAAVRAACRSDFRVHCPGVKPGGSAALRCLQANAAALSPHCRNAVMAMGEGGAPEPAAGGEPAAGPPPALAPIGPIPPMRPRRALEVLSFCGPEHRTLCGNVPPGGGRILECLAENYARLSPECYGALARAARY